MYINECSKITVNRCCLSEEIPSIRIPEIDSSRANMVPCELVVERRNRCFILNAGSVP